jgi:hypothetical protein
MSKIYTGKDYMEFDKQFPLELSKPLKKKPKYMDEVWVSFGWGKAHKGWVLSLTGGDFGTSMKQEMWGDMISIFFPPIKGETFYKGVQTWWLMDIGIGKTKEECLESYCKHDWFKRSKSKIQNDRFWAYVREKQNELV